MRFLVRGLLALFVAGSAALADSAPDSEFRRALAELRGGRPAFAVQASEELRRADNNDWRGWYLRGLFARTKPLSDEEQQRLHEVVPAARRAVLDGFFEIAVSESSEERTAIAERIVASCPDESLAHALATGAMLQRGKFAAARHHAERAFLLDPTSLLAAHAVVQVASSGKSELPAKLVCDALMRHGADELVGRLGIRPCLAGEQSYAVPAVKAALEAVRETPVFREFLLSLLASRAEAAGPLLAATLDPEDETWWPLSRDIFERVCPARSTCPDDAAALALQTVRAIARKGARGHDEGIEQALNLAIAAAKPTAESVEALAEAIGVVAPLRRKLLLDALPAPVCEPHRVPSLRTRLLEIARMEDPRAAKLRVTVCGQTEEVAALEVANPFEQIAPLTVRTLDGKLATLAFDRPTLVVVLRADCGFSQRAIQDWAPVLTRKGALPADVRVAWIHKVESSIPLDKVMPELLAAGIPKDSIFQTAEAHALTAVFRDSAVPYIGLIRAGGELRWERRGWNKDDLGPALAAALGALH